MSRRIRGFLFLFLLTCGSAGSTLWAEEPAPATEPEQESGYRLYLNVKGAWHNFWNTGLFSSSADYGRPGLGASDL
jgi:hypothetical protein